VEEFGDSAEMDPVSFEGQRGKNAVRSSRLRKKDGQHVTDAQNCPREPGFWREVRCLSAPEHHVTRFFRNLLVS